MKDQPTFSRDFRADDLAGNFPPQISNPNKRLVHAIACPEGCAHGGTVGFSRWRAMELPGTFRRESGKPGIEMREDIFTYKPASGGIPGTEWHLNFADAHLFGAYGGPLLAQDELQAAEHPVLGSLREALLSLGLPALTTENGEATPVLVTGVERRCVINTGPNPGEGRPYGLYGNNFAQAGADEITRATSRIDPPTITNIIAIEAPAYGYGEYTAGEISDILVTAYTGFRAAILVSRANPGDSGPVTIHTGFWGCGAYGGNRVLMALLQFIAAGYAGIDRLIFHTVNPEGSEAFAEASCLMDELVPSDGAELQTEYITEEIQSRCFRWGVSDGT